MPVLEEHDAEGKEKWCSMCGNKLPLSEFHRDPETHDGFKPHCRSCRAQRHQEDRAEQQDKRLTEVEEEGLEVLSTLSRGGTFVPHSQELVEALIRPFGGVDGFAKVAYACYYQCRPGSQMRVRILNMIAQMVMKNSELGQAEQRMEDFSDEDLRRLMVRAIKSYQEKSGLPDDTLPISGPGITLESRANRV